MRASIHPKVVGKRLGHGNIRTTIDTYSQVLPGFQEAAARRFDEMLSDSLDSTPATGLFHPVIERDYGKSVSKMLATLNINQ